MSASHRVDIITVMFHQPCLVSHRVCRDFHWTGIACPAVAIWRIYSVSAADMSLLIKLRNHWDRLVSFLALDYSECEDKCMWKCDYESAALVKGSQKRRDFVRVFQRFVKDGRCSAMACLKFKNPRFVSESSLSEDTSWFGQSWSCRNWRLVS
jgi:hypothetical protein